MFEPDFDRGGGEDDDPFFLGANELKRFIKNDGSVMFLGQGDARFAFAQRNGNISKFALDIDGVRQNTTEISILRKYAGFRCFPKLYDFDDRREAGLEVEALAKVRGDIGKAVSILREMGLIDPKTAIGIHLADYMNFACSVCRDMAESGGGLEIDADILEDYSSMGVLPREVTAFARAVHEGKTTQARVFGDLVRYFTNSMNAKRRFITDLHLGNWGYAWREGEIALVLLDCGL